ncbi:MAG TPA: GNAT family protein [Actinomycetes bacterium]
MTSAPEPVVLRNDVVMLSPSATADAPELFAALSDKRVWAFGYGGGPAAAWPDVADAERWLEHAGEALTGPRQAWVVRLAADSALGPVGTVVGTSSLGEWDLPNERLHLGWTAYGPPWWGTVVNPACKLLLLGYAFDTCGFGRVKIQTDLLNERSQAAIAKLGATREGVLRRHLRRADGSWRDSVVFSVIIDDWPQVRERLQRRLDTATAHQDPGTIVRP